MTPRRFVPLFFSLIFSLCSFNSFAFAQEIQDDIFDNPPEAFSNHVQDVPPDILSVRVVPAAPRAGKPFTVEAVVRVDSDMSAMRTARARVTWTTDGVAFKQLSMNLADPKKDLWRVMLPGQPAGASVSFYIDAEDEIGNSVAEIPVQPAPDTNNLWPVVADPRDAKIPPHLDLVSLAFGTDGSTLWFCERFGRPFLSTSFYGVSLVGMGIVAEDARIVRYRSTPEDNVPYFAYVPFLNKKGIYTLGTILGGSPIGSGKVYQRGSRVCGHAPISDLTTTPNHGIKVFAGSAAHNYTTDKFTLFDATPYAILYFKGRTVVVK